MVRVLGACQVRGNEFLTLINYLRQCRGQLKCVLPPERRRKGGTVERRQSLSAGRVEAGNSRLVMVLLMMTVCMCVCVCACESRLSFFIACNHVFGDSDVVRLESDDGEGQCVVKMYC